MPTSKTSRPVLLRLALESSYSMARQDRTRDIVEYRRATRDFPFATGLATNVVQNPE